MDETETFILVCSAIGFFVILAFSAIDGFGHEDILGALVLFFFILITAIILKLRRDKINNEREKR